ncbi:hypothetical protein SDC9_182820 [bioreactor metagenome]|uniref:Uncharacterized protein n=1 Tax=bioreactor metagenome TaxID=1076179 RepID=A0A645HI26_9ZZZZ
MQAGLVLIVHRPHPVEIPIRFTAERLIDSPQHRFVDVLLKIPVRDYSQTGGCEVCSAEGQRTQRDADDSSAGPFR